MPGSGCFRSFLDSWLASSDSDLDAVTGPGLGAQGTRRPPPPEHGVASASGLGPTTAASHTLTDDELGEVPESLFDEAESVVPMDEGLTEALFARRPAAGARRAASEPPSKETRGRKPGTTSWKRVLAEFAADDGANLSRSDMNRAAANARWKAHRGAKAGGAQTSDRAQTGHAGSAVGSVPSAAGAAGSSAASASVPDPAEAQLALVPALPAAPLGGRARDAWSYESAVTFSKAFSSALEARVCALPRRAAKSDSLEWSIVNQSAKVSSLLALASIWGTTNKTISKKNMLIAAIIVIAKRHRFFSFLNQFVEQAAATRIANCPLLFVSKERFDAVQFRMRAEGGESSDSCIDEPIKESAQDIKEGALTKVLQVSVVFSALIRVGNQYHMLQTRGPTTLRAIESDATMFLVEGLRREATIPSWVKDYFKHCMRLVISDDASSNLAADLQMRFRSMEHCTGAITLLLRIVCAVHKEHRVAEVQYNTIGQDARGLLHSTLMAGYQGIMRKMRRCFRRILKRKLVWIKCDDAASAHLAAGELAREQREAIKGKFGQDPQQRLKGPRALKRQRCFLAISELFNGDWSQNQKIEHYCGGCCESWKALYKKTVRHISQVWARPPPWGESRWLGSLESVRWHGFWLNCHAIYEDVFHEAFPSEKDAKAE